MLAFGLAGCGAGRCNCRVDDFGVSLGGNHFLCNEYLVADGAMLALGLAGYGAGSCNSFVDYFRMPLSRNLFLRYKHFIANRAMFAFGLAGCGAGSCNSRIDHLGMTGCGDLFHTGENRITNGALRTGRMTSLGAGSGLFRNINRGMPGCVDCFGLGCIANCAGVGLDTGVLTGRRGRNHAFVPLVALGGNHFLCNDNLVADGAVLAFGLAGLGAGRSLCCVNDFGVSLGGNHFLCKEYLVTDGAVLALSLAGLGAGSLDCRVNDHGVSLGGDGLAVCDLFVTILAVGIAGVAGLGAGGGLGISHFRVLMCASFAAPDAIDIVDNIASVCGRSFGVRAVGVVQLGGGDGDLLQENFRPITSALRVLIRRGLRAGGTLLVIDTGAVAGADVRTALGGVDAAVGGQRTVDVHLHIDKVCFCAVIMLSGGI